MKWIKSTMSLQFSDLLVLSLALSLVPDTLNTFNFCLSVFLSIFHVK